MSPFTRRAILKLPLLAPLVSLPLASRAQLADKLVRLVVPGSAGTGFDVIARFLGEPLGRSTKAHIMVENKVGANGIIATDFVAKAPADGTTLLMTALNHYLNQFVVDTPLPYKPDKDFAPVAKLCSGPLLVLVAANSPYKTLADLIQDMRSRPGEVTYASAGNGSITHLGPLLLNEMTATKARHIPYRGAANAVTDTAGGQVSFTCQSVSTSLGLVKSGQLRALAITGTSRWDALKDVPTVAEAGVPGYTASSWIGVMAPAATPQATVRLLSDALTSIASTAEFRTLCTNQGLTPDVAGAATFGADVLPEVERWKRIINSSHKS